MFIYDSGLVLSCLNIDKSDEERYLIVSVEVVPEHICELVDIAADAYELRLALEAWERIAVAHISMDEVSFTCDRICICECVSLA